MKKRDKKAQAFLITSVILIMVIVGFITIANSSKKTTFSTFPYITEEIQIESEKVMDHDLLNPSNKSLPGFTKDISKYIDKDTRIYFITGKDPNIECYNYTQGIKTSYSNCEGGIDPINITIDNTVHEFPLTTGDHFYFIMIKESKGEKYVYANN